MLAGWTIAEIVAATGSERHCACPAREIGRGDPKPGVQSAITPAARPGSQLSGTQVTAWEFVTDLPDDGRRLPPRARAWRHRAGCRWWRPRRPAPMGMLDGA